MGNQLFKLIIFKIVNSMTVHYIYSRIVCDHVVHFIFFLRQKETVYKVMLGSFT